MLQQTDKLEDHTYVEGSQPLAEEVAHPLLIIPRACEEHGFNTDETPPSNALPTQTNTVLDAC